MRLRVRRFAFPGAAIAMALSLVVAGGAGWDDERADLKKQSTAKKSKKVDMTPVPADEAAEKEALALVGPGFKVKQTAHYSVLYNTSDSEVASFGMAIEGTYRSCVKYVDRLGIDAQPPDKKLIIYYFDEHKDYTAFSKKLGRGDRPQSTPGVYFPDLNRSMFYNFKNQDSFKAARQAADAKIEAMRERLRQPGVTPSQRRHIQAEIKEARALANRAGQMGGALSEGIVQHEVSHQVLWNVGYHNKLQFFANPRWLAEGTAMMFEPIAEGGSANIGAVNIDRLREYQFLEKEGKLIPVAKFVATHTHFDPETIGIAYPQAWAMAHYLNRAKRKQLKSYVEDILTRPKNYKTTEALELAAFEKAFGKPDERWERNWKEWMSKVR